MMATFIVGTPPQIPADATELTGFSHVVTSSGPQGVTVTQTRTLKRITRHGSDGSVTITNGVVTAYTAPT
jgi:hypothetical protein